MTGIHDGGPAFPRSDERNAAGEGIREGADGMSLRDYLAGQALVALKPPSVFIGRAETQRVFREHARLVYELADAMLAERSKT